MTHQIVNYLTAEADAAPLCSNAIEVYRIHLKSVIAELAGARPAPETVEAIALGMLCFGQRLEARRIKARLGLP